MKVHHAWLACVSALAMSAAPTDLAWAQSPEPLQKLVFCSEGSPESLAPSVSSTATSIDVYTAMYDTLVSYVRGETNLVPSLAEHWQVSRDGKEYTFYLQRGVKWHSNAFFKPTRTFNADDVMFTIERQWKASHPYHAVTSANHSYFNAVGFGSLVKSIKKLDAHTVKFSLHQANAAFLSMMSLSFTDIQNADYAKAMLKRGTPEFIDSHPIGTGPFVLVNYDKDQKIVFKAFADYWRGKPKIDELEFAITPSASDRWQKIQSGACHVMPYPNPNDLSAMRTTPGVRVLEQAGLNVGYLAYNTSRAPFDDVRVRKALNMAIDKQAILLRIFQGTGVPATNPIPPTMWSYNPRVQDDAYDPQAAKQLLKEAGWPNGFSTDLWAMPVARAYNPNPRLMAQMIQTDLAAIGVKVTIQSPDWSEYATRMAQGEHSMGLLGWTSGQGDPDSFFYNLLSCESAKAGGPNVAKFCDAPFDDLILRARTTANPTLRIPLYEAAQVRFKEQAPWLPIAHTKQHVVIRDEVVNFRLSPFGRHLFYGVELNARR